MEEHVILLKKGASGDKNVYFIHDGTGDIYVYSQLIRYLSEEYNCWGLMSFMGEGLGPFSTSVEKIAESIASSIFGISRKSGIIVGWSIGGVIGIEVCRQLELKSSHSWLLVLLDPYIPGALIEDFNFELQQEKDLVLGFIEDPVLHHKIFGVDSINSLYNLISEYPECIMVERIKTLLPAGILSAIPSYYTDSEALIKSVNVLRSFTSACDNYKPYKRLLSRVLYINIGGSDPNKKKWAELFFQNIKYCYITCDHYEMLFSPYVAIIANYINKQIFDCDG